MSAEFPIFFEHDQDIVVRSILTDESAPTLRSGSRFGRDGVQLRNRAGFEKCAEKQRADEAERDRAT